MDAARMHALACLYAQDATEENLVQALEAAFPLCAAIARRFSGRGAEYEDLYQVACMACVNALKGFDPGRGFRFSAYVTPTVTGAVRNYLRDRESLLHSPRSLKAQSAQVNKAREEYVALHRQEPTVRHLAQALHFSLAQVLHILQFQAANQLSSLDQREEDGQPIAERLPFLEQGFEKMEQREDLRLAYFILSETEKRLLTLRYQQGFSQRETARQLNMTQMQVSRIERRALSALRKELTEKT